MRAAVSGWYMRLVFYICGSVGGFSFDYLM